MFPSLYYLLLQFGYEEMIDVFEMHMPDYMQKMMKNRALSEEELKCLEKVKNYLQEKSNMSEIDAIGFLAHINLPLILKKHPEMLTLEPETILEKRIALFHTTVKIAA